MELFQVLALAMRKRKAQCRREIEEKRTIGRPWRRWKNLNKLHFKGTE